MVMNMRILDIGHYVTISKLDMFRSSRYDLSTLYKESMKVFIEALYRVKHPRRNIGPKKCTTQKIWFKRFDRGGSSIDGAQGQI